MFQFKKFTIKQDRTAMKVGTDGVLLGAWVDLNSTDYRSLDIGSGTGLIALMLAQRLQEKQSKSQNENTKPNDSYIIDAVEIDKDSAEQATENTEASPWSKNVNLHNVSIADFKSSFKYDMIVSNPPFFSDSLLCPDKSRSAARHTVSLTFDDLITVVVRLLQPTGRFSLILPTTESEKFEMAASGQLYLSRRCNIKSRVDGDIKRVMSEYRMKKTDNVIYEELSIREANSNEYTQEYKDLTSKFYLKF